MVVAAPPPPPCPQIRRSHGCVVRYRLSGVVVHSGSLSGGHYIAYVKTSGSWYYISDGHVTPASEATALKSEAYLLFYVRCRSDGRKS